MSRTIGEKIAALRKAKNITQTQLAEYLFLVPQTISKWEVGNGTPDVALLPRIADFFGVSMDELFGRSSADRARDLVLRYSVLRDDASFREAMDCLTSQLQTIDSMLENGFGDREELEREKLRLEGDEMHLFLQQGREAARRALELAEKMAEETGDMRFRLQRAQLYAMTGENRRIRLECQRNFRESPGLDTLQIYFEILSILGDDERILEMQETDKTVAALMNPPSAHNAALWNQCVQAAIRTGGTAYIERHKDAVLKYGTVYDRYSLLWVLAKFYKDENMTDKYLAARGELVSIIPQVKFENYIADKAQQALAQL